MDKSFNFRLSKDKPLSKIAIGHGILRFNDLYNHVHQLQYGRNSNRKNLELIITEAKGTCSSKHAFLKQVAIENDFEALSLWIGIYKMNAENTKSIHSVLEKYEIVYIPEAHCYLKYKGKRYDITFPNSQNVKFEDYLLEEEEIIPEQVNTYKVQMHRNYIKNWLKTGIIPYSFEEVWNIRETCILALQNKKV
ncbi:hypothetical protein BTO05_02880 [Winogradskyella sp. PC-19]|uniref:hypothetical protein n=1 Tax=unclassified Winogradskyella TaxID=2615021 RepID=UPI000B3BF692|nr:MULTISPECIES: hypothetical protein [unclassified Winogradskyella]ARV08633.1 hypothetical protein BTO05_02880 [Winogradskyella sp. PC-19]RZN81481.1 MAG: hypothetical protein EVB12_03655 [Winogradskyella sp.]